MSKQWQDALGLLAKRAVVMLDPGRVDESLLGVSVVCAAGASVRADHDLLSVNIDEAMAKLKAQVARMAGPAPVYHLAAMGEWTHYGEQRIHNTERGIAMTVQLDIDDMTGLGLVRFIALVSRPPQPFRVTSGRDRLGE